MQDQVNSTCILPLAEMYLEQLLSKKEESQPIAGHALVISSSEARSSPLAREDKVEQDKICNSSSLLSSHIDIDVAINERSKASSAIRRLSLEKMASLSSGTRHSRRNAGESARKLSNVSKGTPSKKSGQ